MYKIRFNRRNFLKVGVISTALSYLGLSDRAFASGNPPKDKAVIWLWLGGGATHIETFDPKPDAPIGIRSVNGHLVGKNGIELGGLWSNLIQRTNDIAVVRSFSHESAAHEQGTHWVMTGHENKSPIVSPPQMEPSYGSIVSSIYGANNPKNGMPTYVRASGIQYDTSNWLGANYDPYDANGEGVKNLDPRVEDDRFNYRYKSLLKDMRKGMSDVEILQDQAFTMIAGHISEAFKVEKEPQAIRDAYGPGVGAQCLLARRLVEAGTRFVTIHHGGWDNHVDIEPALKGLVPPTDKALSALIDDLKSRGLFEKVLIVVTGEFGRTPNVNGTAGRDHWPGLSPLLFAGGGYQMGRVIGKSAPKADKPAEAKITPSDVTMTLFDHFGIDPHIQRVDPAGRPRYFVTEGKAIL